MAVELPPASQGSAPGRPAQVIRGPKKAAMLLVALGPEHAADIFRHLRDEEIEALSVEMARVHQLDNKLTAQVFDELTTEVASNDSMSSGGVDYAREVLEKALGSDHAAELVGRLSSVIEMRPFEFLRRTPAEQIITFLRNEAPQTVALVIANLHTTLAAQVLAGMPPDEQAETALRVAKMGETSPEVVKQVEDVIRQKLDVSSVQQEFAAAGGVKSLADILNHADRSTERNVLDYLSENDRPLGEEVRRLLFVFEDIVKLDDRSIQMILREADQKDLALALRGVAESVKDKIVANMSERGARMLLDEMAIQQPQRKRVVEEAQGRIIKIVRNLEEAGTIVIGRGDGDGVV